MRYYFLNSLFFAFAIRCISAQSNESCGARASAMGNAMVTVSDEWASFHNIAGIAAQKKYAIGLWYKNDFAVSAYQETAGHIVGPLWKGGVVASFYKFGNEQYSSTQIAVGYAHKINLVSLGVQAHYLQISMEGLGVRRNMVVDFGGIVELVPSKIFFGAHLINPFQAKINHDLLPVIMKAGLSYRPGKKTILNGEVEKDILYRPSIKLGLEYTPLSNFRIRTGINTNPFLNFFGVGFQNRSVQFDYALSKHPQLGYSHRISILVFFNKIK